jgi:hypothetical protein
MPARPPSKGLEQPPWPDDGEEASAKAELRIWQIPIGGDERDTSSGEQVTPAPRVARRIMDVVRRAGFGGVLRMAVRPEDGGQMIAAIERIMVTLTWAATVITTVSIMAAADRPVSAMIWIIGLELSGFVMTLFATRWRRDKSGL